MSQDHNIIPWHYHICDTEVSFPAANICSKCKKVTCFRHCARVQAFRC